jgi:N-methylhydantoinase A
VHGIESGKDLRPRTLIAFGGAAPLHAARVAEKIGVSRVLIPTNASVGSAVGLLRAPVAYEIVRGRLMRLSTFDPAAANGLLAEMRAEAEAIVRQGAPVADLTEQRSVFMRYRGQGHEIGSSFHCAISPRPTVPRSRICLRRRTGGSIAGRSPALKSKS